MTESRPPLVEILAAEYQALKAEQTARIAVRENAVGANFIAVGAILAVAAALESVRNYVLLLIPFAAASTYWVYLNNDIHITALQRFFRFEFPAQVALALGLPRDDPAIRNVLGRWETYVREQKGRALRKAGNTLFIVIGAAGTSVAALVVTFTAVWPKSSYAAQALWSGAALVTLLVVIALIRTSDIGSGRAASK